MKNYSVFDLEADGLNPTKIWCIAAKDKGGKLKSTANYNHMRSFFSKQEMLIGHNIQRFDIPVVERILNIKIKAFLVDTLALSWYLYPELLKHGLEEWGEYFGVAKPKIDNWNDLTVEEYLHRCEEDVRINTLLWEKMWNDLNTIYDKDEDRIWKLIRYLSFKMDCAREQERSGWKLDVEKCREEARKLSEEQAATVEKLVVAMPRVKKYASKPRPAKPFKKDGSYSATGARWFSLVRRANPQLSNEEVESFQGTVDVEVSEEAGNPNSHVQVKDWLYSLGWKPETFKYQRDKETGDVRSIPQINLEHGAGICPSISKLFDIEPNLRLLDGLGVLQHRIGLLNGFMRDVSDDGSVKAKINGFTNTLRVKHKEVVNLPGVGKPYGEIIRGVLIASDNEELCGSDMSGLEDRLKQHYIYPYDPEYVKEMNTEDYDPHLALALQGGALRQEDVDKFKWFSKLKEEDRKGVSIEIVNLVKNIKPIRHTFKQGNYACQYGAGAPRLALTADISEKEAKKIHKAYWEKNWAIKKAAEDQITKTVNGQMWLLNPINGFWYSLRYEKDIFSTLVQGSASYVFDLWLRFIRSKRPQLTAQFHDEIVLTIKRGNRDKAHSLLRWAIDETNKKLRLNRELDIDIQFGGRYSDIH